MGNNIPDMEYNTTVSAEVLQFAYASVPLDWNVIKQSDPDVIGRREELQKTVDAAKEEQERDQLESKRGYTLNKLNSQLLFASGDMQKKLSDFIEKVLNADSLEKLLDIIKDADNAIAESMGKSAGESMGDHKPWDKMTLQERYEFLEEVKKDTDKLAADREKNNAQFAQFLHYLPQDQQDEWHKLQAERDKLDKERKEADEKFKNAYAAAEARGDTKEMERLLEEQRIRYQRHYAALAEIKKQEAPILATAEKEVNEKGTEVEKVAFQTAKQEREKVDKEEAELTEKMNNRSAIYKEKPVQSEITSHRNAALNAGDEEAVARLNDTREAQLAESKRKMAELKQRNTQTDGENRVTLNENDPETKNTAKNESKLPSAEAEKTKLGNLTPPRPAKTTSSALSI